MDYWAIAWAEAQKRNSGFYDHTPNDFADHNYAASIAANMPNNHDPFENGLPDFLVDPDFLSDDFDDVI